VNNLQIFKNEKFGSIRTLNINGEPYFVVKDVAKVLGYSNPRKAISDHVDAEDKGVTKCDTLGGAQKLNVINESGLYSLILSSKLPKAKEFKHWVTSEVLPNIRKTGGYGQIDVEKIVGMTVSETIKQLIPLLQQNSANAYIDNGDAVEEIVIRKRARKKAPGIIEKLPDDLRTVIDDMICSNRYTYQDVVDLLADEGIHITTTSVYRYAKRYF